MILGGNYETDLTDKTMAGAYCFFRLTVTGSAVSEYPF